MDIGQNISYLQNISKNENIGIGLGGQYVVANIGIGKNIGLENISVSVSLLAGPILVQP
jgi:hypothetical protein